MENTPEEKANVVPTPAEKQLAALQLSHAQLQEKHDTLVGSLYELHGSHLDLQEKVAILEKMLTAKTEITVGKKKELPTIPAETVKVEGKEYAWKVAVFYSPIDSKKITAEEASQDEEVITAVLAIPGQGMLVEVK